LNIYAGPDNAMAVVLSMQWWTFVVIWILLRLNLTWYILEMGQMWC